MDSAYENESCSRFYGVFLFLRNSGVVFFFNVDQSVRQLSGRKIRVFEKIPPGVSFLIVHVERAAPKRKGFSLDESILSSKINAGSRHES